MVSRHAAREKSIRHGHPSTLHLWWARRPLASSRAVLLALLLPDPCDPLCPEAFRRAVAGRLRELAGHLVETRTGSALLIADLKADLRSRKPGVKQAAEREAGRRAQVWRDLLANSGDWTPVRVRSGLLQLVAQGAAWEWSAAKPFLEACRDLVQVAHGGDSPLVVDPFAGGGSIPLEALRLGCEAFASDLNPVACLILKVMLEDIPRHGPQLADELRRVGGQIKVAAEKELADLYPADPDGATPIAYLWARTVRCEAPNCGAEIPLLRSFWLCKKDKRKRALRYRVERPESDTPRVVFEVFKPGSGKEVPDGTVSRARATCLCCRTVLVPERVRAQLAAERGGADVVFDERGQRVGGARLTAVVTLCPGVTGRHYRLPTAADYAAVRRAQGRVARVLAEWERGGRRGLCPVPDEPLPPIGTLGFRVQRYGMDQWGDLFTARQKAALVELGRLSTHGSEAVQALLAMVTGRCADYSSAGVVWAQEGEFVAHTFGRQALPIVWDFAEPVQCRDSSGSFEGAVDWVARVVDSWPGSGAGQHQQADAAQHPLPDQAAGIWFTDPPYYDAIPYSDLSDFFLAWLKRALPDQRLLRDPFDPDNPLSPKTAEAVQDETKKVDGRPKDRPWFEATMARAFGEGRRVLHEDGVGSVVFAHKTTEGWEALLSGMVRGGWTITASWPIATERPGRLRSQDSAALATSVHLVCRPRPEDAPVGDWADVLRDLPRRVADWMDRLQNEGIRGADLVFACVGPALEIFSRYRAVETAEGRPVGLAEYLEKVWEVVGRTALESVLGAAEAKARNGLAGALEEDARLTALFLWTLQATAGDATGETVEQGADSPAGETTADEHADDTEGAAAGKAASFSLVFDVVRRFAQPLGIDLDKWEKRTIETKKGVVRLLPVAERATQLFGKQGTHAVAAWLEQEARAGADPLQGVLFPDPPRTAALTVRERRPRFGESGDDGDFGRDRSPDAPATTTLDRVHTGMLLQAGGQTNALRALVQAERDRGPDFLRLANALSALYPRGSHEKRLLDAMLLAAPR